MDADYSSMEAPRMDPTKRSHGMQRLVEQIWHFTWNPIYSQEFRTEGKISCSAEASTLDANRHIRPRNQCPCCDGYFMRRDLIRPIIVGSGEDSEIGGWIFRCPNTKCGAHLTIFND